MLQFDITFHKMPCAWTSLDAMDISGEMHLDVVSHATMYPCRHRAPVLCTESNKLKYVQRIILNLLQDHDVYKKRLQADGTPIDEGVKHTIGPENLDLMSKDNVDENGTACGSCYGAQTATQPCCNTCDEVIACNSNTWFKTVSITKETNMYMLQKLIC